MLNCSNERAAALKLKIAVYAISFVTLVYLVPLVAMADIVASFPGAPKAVVLYVVSLPCLTALIAILSVPTLRRWLSLKKQTLCGLAVLLAGGLMAVAVRRNLPALLAASALQGLGYGVLTTVYPLLTVERFDAGARRQVMGGCTGMVQLGRMLALLAAGRLAEQGWHRIYYTYVFFAVAFVLVARFLPEDAPAPRPADTAAQPPRRNRLLATFRSPYLLFLSISSCLFMVVYGMTANCASLYVADYALGGPSVTGALSSVAGGVAVVMCFLSARIRRVTGRYTGAFAFAVIGAGFLFAGRSISLAALGAGLVLASFAKSQLLPNLMVSAGEAVGPTLRPVATSVALTGLNLGQFLSPTVTIWLAGMFGDGSAGDAFAFAGMAALVLGVVTCAVECALSRREKRSGGENADAA